MNRRFAVWADGFGVWHVRVNIGDTPEESSGAVILARKVLRDELVPRVARLSRNVWANPIRVPELDEPGSIVYREGEA